VAKATSQKLTEKTLFTQHASMIGTPAYMSPEQAEMSGLDIDTRTDVYSLGALLYNLLVGAAPLDDTPTESMEFGLLLEPVLNPVWAWLVHGEVLAADLLFATLDPTMRALP
jgi:serine/threonine protein kinase